MIRTLNAGKQDCLPVVNHSFVLITSGHNIFFHVFSCLPVNSQTQCHKWSRRQQRQVVVSITRLCCFSEPCVSESWPSPETSALPARLQQPLHPPGYHRISLPLLSFCSLFFVSPPRSTTHLTLLLLSSCSSLKLLICCLLNPSF